MELPSGIPSHDTFNRVSAALDPHAFLACFAAWVEGICPNLSDEVVAIDGKALRRALNEGESIPYIVSAWASENGLALDRDLGGAGFTAQLGPPPDPPSQLTNHQTRINRPISNKGRTPN